MCRWAVMTEIDAAGDSEQPGSAGRHAQEPHTSPVTANEALGRFQPWRKERGGKSLSRAMLPRRASDRF
jgi:hypothetical protein